MSDQINHPTHYTSHPSGLECIDFTKRMDFMLGNAFKYFWRHSLKNGTEDLKKSLWYINAYMDMPRTSIIIRARRLFDMDPPVHVLDPGGDCVLSLLWFGWKYDRRDLLANAKVHIETSIAMQEAEPCPQTAPQQ